MLDKGACKMKVDRPFHLGWRLGYFLIEKNQEGEEKKASFRMTDAGVAKNNYSYHFFLEDLC